MTQLRDAERSVAAGGPLVGTVLVVAEVALAVILLTGAVLLIRTFVNLNRVDPGFDADRVLTAEVSLTTERYREDADRVDFFRRAVEEIQLAAQRSSRRHGLSAAPVRPAGYLRRLGRGHVGRRSQNV